VNHTALDDPIPFVTVTNWVRSAARCGFNVEPLLREAGMDLQHLHPSEARITLAAMLKLMEGCIEQTRLHAPHMHFPQVLGETFAFEYLSDIETFITTSPTLRDAAPALQWLPQLINPFMALNLQEHGHQARLRVDFVHESSTPKDTWHFAESVLATFCKVARLLLGHGITEGEITLQHQRPPNTPEWTNALGVPIRYGCELNALWFERRLLDRPLQGALPSLHETAAQRVNQQLAKALAPTTAGQPLQDGPLATRIHTLLHQRQDLLGQGIDAIARELALHPRTMQRHLRDEGLVLSAIVDQVRHTLATGWLADPALSIEEISARLGFTDRRSFTQAFTRWAGMPPTQWRRQGNPSPANVTKTPLMS
jgi:AraC-like DNA-binding protein